MEHEVIVSLGTVMCEDDPYVLDQITEVLDTSSPTGMFDTHSFKRLRINFKNGYSISIVQGHYAYSEEDTFEIAVFNPFDDMVRFDNGDTVQGHCSLKRISEVMKKFAYL